MEKLKDITPKTEEVETQGSKTEEVPYGTKIEFKPVLPSIWTRLDYETSALEIKDRGVMLRTSSNNGEAMELIPMTTIRRTVDGKTKIMAL